MKRKILYIAFPLFLILLIFYHFSITKEKHHILVIHSFEPYYEGYNDMNAEIVRRFRSEGIEPDIRYIYLNCESVLEKDELKSMDHLIDSVTASGWKPEVILVNDDQATYSLLKCGHPLTRKIPIVFAGVNYPNWKLLRDFHNVTGYEDKIDILANITFIKRITKSNPHIFTVLDSTFIDNKIRHDAMAQLKGKKVVGFMTPLIPYNRQVYLYKHDGYVLFNSYKARGRNLETANLLWAVSKFGEKMFYLQMKRDFTTINIGDICANYSFCAINEEFGFSHKLIGGYFTPIQIQAEEEVCAAVKILRGANPSGMPVLQSKKKYLVDWEVMREDNLELSDIPSYCEIINIPYNKEHPIAWIFTIVLGLSLLLIIFTHLILLLSKERRRKKEAYAELKHERETLQLAIEGSNTFAWTFQNDRFVFDNSFWKFIGLQPRALTKEEMVSYIHPNYQRSFLNFQATIDSKGCLQILSNFNGTSYQWWEIRSSTLQKSNGKNKMAGLLLNIQEFKDREQELENARLLAEKAEMKQSFMANMSHEIRTPLNAIVGFSNLLANSDNMNPEVKKKYVELINDNNESLLGLIDEVMTLSRIDSGQILFKKENTTLKDILETIYLNYHVNIPSNIQFIKEEDSVNLGVNTDTAHLIEVLTHLLRNAVKFTKEGYIKIGYRYLSDSQEVEIYVEDSGRGIPDDEQRMIFYRFYKRDIFTQGAGLGLSVCKSIIEKLNGRITVSSELGKGSRFSVVLPCAVI